MVKKTINYEDLDGNKVEETFYFDLTQTELTEMQLSTEGGLNEKLQQAVKDEDNQAIFLFVKDLLLKSYFVKSADNKRKIKNQQLRDEFEQSIAFDIIFTELISDDKVASAFVKGILPANLASQLDKASAN